MSCGFSYHGGCSVGLETQRGKTGARLPSFMYAPNQKHEKETDFTVTHTAALWPVKLTATAPRLNLDLGSKTFHQRPAISSFLWLTSQHSWEEMADMDELFGSDGESDNDQRGNDVSQVYKVSLFM